MPKKVKPKRIPKPVGRPPIPGVKCPRGHYWSANQYFWNGKRQCMACRKENLAAFEKEEKQKELEKPTVVAIQSADEEV